jgi:hypothetical protein
LGERGDKRSIEWREVFLGFRTGKDQTRPPLAQLLRDGGWGVEDFCGFVALGDMPLWSRIILKVGNTPGASGVIVGEALRIEE